MDKFVSFSADSAKRFTASYNRAKNRNLEKFFFEGNEYVVSYAYYVIQYLVMNNVLSGEFDNNKIFKVK